MRVRRAARDRSCLRPQRHRRRRPRRRTRCRIGRRRRRGQVRILGTPAEEGGGGKVLMAAPGRVRRARRGDDGAPGRRRPARHATASPSSGSTVEYHGRGRPRRGGAAPRPQRARRRRARLHERGRPPPAHPPRRSGCTASSPTPASKPNIVPARRRRGAGTCGRRDLAALAAAQGPGARRASRPGPLPPAAR